ncbi:hypothetical protein pipiens_005512 [Culex pipiens pipiens]|uniref:C2H2-type domain-containing protein n=1 Tax=Culex pipiens pipiens TaxID=38569 RepID=A0ABD1DXR2_CULPP
MLKLRRDLRRTVTLLEMIERREKIKREQLYLSIEKRYQAQDFVSFSPAFALSYSNQNSLHHRAIFRCLAGPVSEGSRRDVVLSLDLLHKFQRILFTYTYQSKTDNDLSGAEALLDSYIQQVVTACVTTLNKAHETRAKKATRNFSDSRFPSLRTPHRATRTNTSSAIEGEVHDSDDMEWLCIICGSTYHNNSYSEPQVDENKINIYLQMASDAGQSCGCGRNAEVARNRLQNEKLWPRESKRLRIRSRSIRFARASRRRTRRVVVLEKTVPSKNLLKVHLINSGNELRPPLLLMKNLRAFAFRQFVPSARGQRVYPDPDEQRCGASEDKFGDSLHESHPQGSRGKLDEVTFRNFVCDFKQVDINNCLHIPQDNSIVRIAKFVRSFHNKTRLKWHMVSHRNKTARCEVCSEEFPDGRSFMNNRSHTESRQFPCHECGKTFGSRSSQQIHLRVHSGERP